MKVRFFGFTFEAVSKNLTLDQWASHLHNNPPNIGAVIQGQRLLLINDAINQNCTTIVPLAQKLNNG